MKSNKKCPECKAYFSHSPKCSLIDFKSAKEELIRYYELWLKRENKYRKIYLWWMKESQLWKGKFYELKHENNQLRKKYLNNIDMITDEQINEAFKNTDYGKNSPKDIIRMTLLKAACGHSNNYTSTRICTELKLLSNTGNISKKGKEWLYESYVELMHEIDDMKTTLHHFASGDIKVKKNNE